MFNASATEVLPHPRERFPKLADLIDYLDGVGERVDLKRGPDEISMRIVSIDVLDFSLSGPVSFDLVLGDPDFEPALASARLHVEGRLRR
jgi:hypothetical protein